MRTGGGIKGRGAPGGGAGPGGIPDAPRDANAYARSDGAWVAVPKVYVHFQDVASDVWTIQHDLNTRDLTVTLFDSSGDEIEGEISWPNSSDDQIRVHFGRPVSGTARVKF
jgi:hypothetical protein